MKLFPTSETRSTKRCGTLQTCVAEYALYMGTYVDAHEQDRWTQTGILFQIYVKRCIGRVS